MSNFEKPPIGQSEVPETVKTENSEHSDSPEKLITSEHKLRYINKSLELLRPDLDPDGKKIK